uniref:Uncharacterized protein n=1 Tax=Uncultured archaeon GZfos26G2 TaxID=3386331 RepID=Q64C38_UNCAG|nr:hypothetical protein GZ26D6_15 [uncultured archaeon GZfos26D6]
MQQYKHLSSAIDQEVGPRSSYTPGRKLMCVPTRCVLAPYKCYFVFIHAGISRPP